MEVDEVTTEKLIQNLAFDVEIVPKDNNFKEKNMTPVNVKVRVRKKEEAGAQRGVISVPRLQISTSKPHERIRLASSDQTIMSFNLLMENADLDRKASSKSRKGFFGSCLGMQGDDEDPYMPANSDNEIRSSSQDIPSPTRLRLALSKNTGDDMGTVRKPVIFFGKCKPGGCLDPPYGEEKYAYVPSELDTSTTISPNEDETLNKMLRGKIKNENTSTSKGKIKSDSDDYSTYTGTTAKVITLDEKDSDSVITYPPALSDEEMLKQIANNTRNSITRSRQSSNEFNTTYFNPRRESYDKRDKPRRSSLPLKNVLETETHTPINQNNLMLRSGGNNLKDDESLETPNNNAALNTAGSDNQIKLLLRSGGNTLEEENESPQTLDDNGDINVASPNTKHGNKTDPQKTLSSSDLTYIQRPLKSTSEPIDEKIAEISTGLVKKNDDHSSISKIPSSSLPSEFLRFDDSKDKSHFITNSNKTSKVTTADNVLPNSRKTSEMTTEDNVPSNYQKTSKMSTEDNLLPNSQKTSSMTPEDNLLLNNQKTSDITTEDNALPNSRKTSKMTTEDNLLPNNQKTNEITTEDNLLPNYQKISKINTEDNLLPNSQKTSTMTPGDNVLLNNQKTSDITTEDSELPNGRETSKVTMEDNLLPNNQKTNEITTADNLLPNNQKISKMTMEDHLPNISLDGKDNVNCDRESDESENRKILNNFKRQSIQTANSENLSRYKNSNERSAQQTNVFKAFSGDENDDPQNIKIKESKNLSYNKYNENNIGFQDLNEPGVAAKGGQIKDLHEKIPLQTTDKHLRRSISSQPPPILINTPKVSFSSDKIYLDLVFDINNSKTRVVKTLDSEVHPTNENSNDDLMIKRVNELIGPGDEIRIPIDSTNDMSIQVKKATAKKANFDELLPLKGILVSEHNEIDINLPITSHTPSCEILHESLTSIYEQELVPLEDIIKNLKEQIDALVESRKAKVVHSNKPCTCSKKFKL